VKAAWVSSFVRTTPVQRDVALKLLPDHFANDANRLLRFQREAQVLASLNHPNSAQIYGLEESNNTRCIVMELVAGETLQERLKRGPIPLDEALVIAKQIAEALEVAHEKGIIHRDLKPANIKLTPDAQVKVLDFGLAKAFQEQPESRVSDSPTLISASVPGVILGTLAYMVPEQADGLAADKRSDIWSYGVVLWEMLTGKRLFEAPSVSRLLADVLGKEIEFSASSRHARTAENAVATLPESRCEEPVARHRRSARRYRFSIAAHGADSPSSQCAAFVGMDRGYRDFWLGTRGGLRKPLP
jgi:eukaryotic-like serine/threonine-protein kinase